MEGKYYNNNYITGIFKVQSLEDIKNKIDGFITQVTNTDNFDLPALKDSLFYEINSRFKDIKNVTYDFIEITLTAVYDSLILMGNVGYIRGIGTVYQKCSMLNFIVRDVQMCQSGGWGTLVNDPINFIEFKHIDPETNEESLVGFKIDRHHIYD